MDAAKELFEKIQSFKSTELSPEQQLLEYCIKVLGPVERIHFDFKEKSECSIPELSVSDKKNFAKAISGFANSGGGVLIWGIEDASLKPKPISEITKFLSELLKLAHQTTDPSVIGIDGVWLPSDSQEEAGFAIIFIPESTLPPHRVTLKDKDIQNHYYVRSGENFYVATHTQLEDMFGRRPKPNLSFITKIQWAGNTGTEKQRLRVILGIENKGRGSAKAPFLSMKISQPYQIDSYGIDGNGKFGLEKVISAFGSDENKYGSTSNIVIHPGIVHDVTAIKVEVEPRKYSPAEVKNVTIDYTIIAEGMLPVTGQSVITSKELYDALPMTAI